MLTKNNNNIKQMKRQTLVNGLLSLTVFSFMTGCVDDKYDLSNIDTTSRFIVDDLTVPINLSEIKLDKVIKLNNENISVEDGTYAIKKDGAIAPTEFTIGGVQVNAPQIAPSSVYVGMNGLSVPPGTFIPGNVELGPISIQPSDLVGYEFRMENIDKALLVLNNIKTTPIEIKVELKVPEVLATEGNKITFENLELQLPWGLTGVSGVSSYDPATGKVTVAQLMVGSNGKAILPISADGLELNEKGEVKNQELAISGKVGVMSGQIRLSVQNVTMPESLDIDVNYTVSSFDIESFSGKIDYNMDDINIAPISLNDLPDFLNDPMTNIIIANPQINVKIKNPVAKYGLTGHGRLTLSSKFKEGNPISRSSDVFNLTDSDGDGICNLTFAPEASEGDPNVCAFPGLGYVLTVLDPNPSFISGGQGLPESISVLIEDLNFAGDVEDFPLSNIGSAEGDYTFNAPLGFENGSTVFYETTEDGWSSDDLDKVNIKTINLVAKCSTDLPVSLQLSVEPVDKSGKVISIIENSKAFDVPANAKDQIVTLTIKAKEGTTITNFDGIKFTAIIGQHSPWYPDGGGTTEALGPDLLIKLDDLRVTVDGYYETDF